jgi:hypothetical protein
MRRRLYFVLPDVESARRAMEDLLLARIEYRNIHVLARRGTSLGDLPEAGYSLKSDLVHGALVGSIVGAVGGLIVGAAIVAFPIEGTQPELGTVVIAVVIGALLGAWIASMVGAAVPNSRLKAFQQDIERGSLLMIVDVPYRRVDEIRALLLSRHPETLAASMETRYPAFP